MLNVTVEFVFARQDSLRKMAFVVSIRYYTKYNSRFCQNDILRKNEYTKSKFTVLRQKDKSHQ